MSESKKVEYVEATVKDFTLLLIPMIVISVVMAYMLRTDYILNNNSFSAKSRFCSQLPISYYNFYDSVSCSNDYIDDRKKFPTCAPKECGRFVTDYLVTPEEASALLNVMKRALNYGSSSGSASIFDIHSGALSFNDKFINLYTIAAQKNLTVYTKEELEIYKTVRNRIMNKVKELFKVDDLYPTKPTFFSQLTSKPPLTQHDEYWHTHVDKTTYQTFQYTSLVYLSSHNLGFYAGEFVFDDEKSVLSIEPKLGRVILFTSGSENAHHVKRVERGERYALTIAFTCDKSFSFDDSVLG